MPTAVQEAAVSPEDLLQQVRQLDDPALDDFLSRARLVQTERRVRHLSEQETELLLKINTPLLERTWKRYTKLYAKMRADSISRTEYAELLELINVVEMDNAERIGNLITLASLRGTTLKALMKSLGIAPALTTEPHVSAERRREVT